MSEPAVGRRRRFAVVVVAVVAAAPVAGLVFAWQQWRVQRAQDDAHARETVYGAEQYLRACEPSRRRGEGAMEPPNFNSCVSSLETDLDTAELRGLCPVEDIARARAVLARGRAEHAEEWGRMP
jgi:hypothetical protein